MARFDEGAGGGGDANVADFIFPSVDEDVSSITLPINKEMTLETTRDDGGDADINIVAADAIFIEATGDDVNISAFNEVDIATGDDGYIWTFDDQGNFQLPGNGYISNPIDSSGDPSTPNADTMHLVPDGSIESDQYLILDPTAPNHIHIRAGGDIDESTADLILGGEKTNVVVSDSARDVFINTRPDQIINTYTNLNEVNNINFIVSDEADIDLGYVVNVDGTDYIVNSVTPDSGLIVVTATGAVFTAGQPYTFTYNPEYTNSWEFGSNGYLYGPAEGKIKILGVDGGATGTFTSQDSKLITVTNGIITSIEVVP